jgi:threonine dehydrogenase-like Zn-dependent dehydrogenase
VIAESDQTMVEAIRSQFQPQQPDPYGRELRGFDDVILAAGGPETVAVAHELLAPTGGRILTFAGTRGPCQIESGVWHYGNAGVSGTSGCNTKMMEVALGLLARGSIDVSRLSGHAYTFAHLKEKGAGAFFQDRYLRPKLLPNEGLAPVDW